MDAKVYFMLLLTVAVIFETVADFLFKKWSIDNRNLILISGFLIYMIGTLFWAYSLKFGDISKAIVVFTLVNAIAIIIIGLVYFNEKISLINKIGIIGGLISIILLMW